MPRARREVLAVQGGYYVVTGLAPFVSRRLFERVTGRKTEWWLVQTVGGLLAAAGAGLVSGVIRDRVTPELAGIAAGCAATLGAVDVAYVARGRISPVYLVDALVEGLLLAGLATAREPEGG